MSAAVEADAFERLYSESRDPWGYETSDYERGKYARTLAALPEGRIGHVLEMGCSIGVFTELLAPRCEQLLAVDFSPTAVEAAERRTSGLANVRVERADLRAGLPPGHFDLILCAEVLYYWEAADVERVVRAITEALTPGGSLITVHWRGVDPDAPLDAERTGAIVAATPGLRHAHGEVHERYLLDRWERCT